MNVTKIVNDSPEIKEGTYTAEIENFSFDNYGIFSMRVKLDNNQRLFVKYADNEYTPNRLAKLIKLLLSKEQIATISDDIDYSELMSAFSLLDLTGRLITVSVVKKGKYFNTYVKGIKIFDNKSVA